MKSTIVKLIAAFIAMLLGLLLLETTHHAVPLLTGSLFIIVGFSYITYTLVEMLRDYKVFEFCHYYYFDDPINNNKSVIVKELNYDERTQLRYYDDTLFKRTPIVVDEHEEIDRYKIQYRVTGWIKARDADEATRILHYTTNWDAL